MKSYYINVTRSNKKRYLMFNYDLINHKIMNLVQYIIENYARLQCYSMKFYHVIIKYIYLSGYITVYNCIS